jgi:acyl-coenzyme A thioesterase PaaI-like protein
MKLGYKIIDKLMENPTKINLIALDKVMTLGIPFNAPHGMTIRQISDDQVRVSLPNRKLNHNHIGGIHACAMATVGEYCAGLSLLSCFGISKYRLIMSELSVTYTWQGRTDLEGICSPRVIDKEAVKTALESGKTYTQSFETVIQEGKTGKEVARVKTTWQLKPWGTVKTQA